MSGTVRRAFVGLGSNLSNPPQQLGDAFDELARLPNTVLHAASSMYRSPPLGPPGQPDYLNAVAAIDTGLGAHELLDQLQHLEDRHGRERVERWGPRTLDLDLLLYGDAVIRTERLVVPHPQMRYRAFVLIPLQEIAPELVMPELGALSALVERLGRHDVEPIDRRIDT